MAEIILHQYPQSPVAEKVRVGLGIKNLPWRSVEIPRLPPKPDLIPLTGGYRRTPVMQIGADIYCDSQCILRELERRHPEPGYYPPNGDHYSGGLSWALSRWTDDRLFRQTIELVLAGAGDALPADFAEDRGRLYFGSEWEKELQKARDELGHTRAQLRGQFTWLNDWLASQSARQLDYLLANRPGIVDACAYYLVWFVRGRWSGGPEFLAEFPHLETWEKKVKDIGHGNYSELSASEALTIALNSTTITPETSDDRDVQGLVPGAVVDIGPDIDGGEVAVTGVVHAVKSDTISVLRESPETGEVCVHFPRVGYRIQVKS